MIELQHISRTFNRNSPNEVKALQDVSMTIDSSSFVVIVGSNGSGKSSLLNALAGSIPVDGGKILVDENDVTGLKEYERSRWFARIFQDPLMGTASDLSILENFRLASMRTRPKKFMIGTGEKFKKEVREKIALLNLGLENKIDQQMGTLSGGQRQALTLMMSVMPAYDLIGQDSSAYRDETKILLMDEPAAALDPKTSELVMKLAEKIIREFHLTALLITHRVKDMVTYGDRVILMKEGRISKDLNMPEKSKLQLNDVYSWF
jgi:putative ABC transport system ATP-binding protein